MLQPRFELAMDMLSGEEKGHAETTTGGWLEVLADCWDEFAS